MKNIEKKSQGMMRKALNELGLMSKRLFRGTLCALCMDPDAPLTTIYDGGVLVKDTDVTEIKNKVKKALTDTKEAAAEQGKAVRA